MPATKSFDLSAYLIIGPENTLNRPVKSVIQAAIKGGITFIQIRSKVADAKDLIAYTRDAAAAIAEAGQQDRIKLVVDDRLDVVLAARDLGIKVDGLHIGQSDLPIDFCRQYLGPDAILGVSARNAELLAYVKETDVTDIDYFGAGPFHPTQTKPEAGRDEKTGEIHTRQVAELIELAHLSPIPVVVGGGVKLADMPQLKATGVAGFFVITAITEASDPERATRALVTAWQA
ncbi:thiamine phosphate synthase [Weissella diestrammenae]|uniref:Thiamine-phosphate synthase n=1 Tax=Weissella diestrammenae TaxID=1162633 RepID=A0A7G9T717_9LACO|nr:thiamine phosphate synthase [Weissella diestrammenae]MCM0582511.1 thiamine phosphate synthase [Weissella diestrammenae]QNN75892.1 thiamine phosphate synthase [Weissella diestrammenae]